MARILLYIACGALLAQTCNIVGTVVEVLPPPENREFMEEYSNMDRNTCDNRDFFDTRCPEQFLLIIEKPD